MDQAFWVALGAIIWVDIILSGDNAIVIALACRGLPEKQRKWGIILGAAVAITLRLFFAVIVAQLLGVPFLKIVGGLLLFWIAVKLITEEAGEEEVATSDKLWKAVQTVAIADVVMSLDNVLAIAAVAKGNNTLMVLGVLISIPLIIAGAQIIIKVIERYPILIWAGSALLGFFAGEMIISDVKTLDFLSSLNPAYVNISANAMIGRVPVGWLTYSAGAIGAALVIAVAWIIKNKHKTA